MALDTRAVACHHPFAMNAPVRLASLLAAAASLLVAGCGGADHAPPPAQPTTAAKLDPPVGGHELMRIKRIGESFGTSDVVKYGSDGSVVVIKMYGGGGSLIERCRLRAGELPRLERDVRRLPLGPAPKVKERPRPTFYTLPSPSYVLQEGGRLQTFTQDAMPRNARPLVRRLEGTLTGRVAHCVQAYRTRRA